MLNRIESLKAIAAIMVVAIHVTAYIRSSDDVGFWNYYIYRGVLDLAVPFFFAVTGYLLVKKNAEYLKRYTKKILSLFIAASLMYLVYKMFIIVMDKLVLDVPFRQSIEKFIASLDMTKFMQGTFGEFHLWYLMATVIAVYIFSFIKDKPSSVEKIFALSAVFYVSYITGLIDFSGVAIWGGFPKGMFYIALGMYIGSKEIAQIKKPLIKAIISGVLFGSVYAIGVGETYHLLMALTIYYIVVWAVQAKGKQTILSKLGKYSLGIYIMHVMGYNLIYKIMTYIGMDVAEFKSNYMNLFGVIIVTVIFSIATYKIIEKTWMKIIEKAMNDIL